MKSLGNLPDIFLAEIVSQPDAMLRAADALSAAGDALGWIAERARRPAVFTGMGASYDACHAPVTVLAEAGVPASMVDAAELLHFRTRALDPGSPLVLVSQSGRSAELVALVGALRERPRRPLLVSVTNGLDNPLAAAADSRIDVATGEELGPSTTTFVATLVALAGVAGVVAGTPLRDAVAAAMRGARAAANAARRALDDPVALARELRSWLGGRERLFLLGRGAGRAAAESGALVLKEAARLPAEALETAQFRHGPLELASESMAAIVVATEPATRDLDVGLAGELAASGAAVLVVVAADVDVPDGLRRFDVAGVPRELAPAVAVLPAQLLAWRLAVERGLDPGMLSIATKVTARE